MRAVFQLPASEMSASLLTDQRPIPDGRLGIRQPDTFLWLAKFLNRPAL